jgi:hypothetical protein
MPKLCDIPRVRQYGVIEPQPLELWRDDESGRLVIRAYNEGGYSGTEVDLLDLIEWLSTGPRPVVVLENGTRAISIGDDLLGN